MVAARGLAEQAAEEASLAAPMSVGTGRVGVVPPVVISPVRPGRVPVTPGRVRVAAVPARVPHIRSHPAAVVVLLGPHDLFQLAVIEEDAPAVLALFQAHALLVDGSQRPMAFRTCHAISIGSVALGQHSESAPPEYR